MKTLKSTLAKTALADPIAKERLRQYVATAHPLTIELNGQRYRVIRVPSHICPFPGKP